MSSQLLERLGIQLANAQERQRQLELDASRDTKRAPSVPDTDSKRSCQQPEQAYILISEVGLETAGFKTYEEYLRSSTHRQQKLRLVDQPNTVSLLKALPSGR
jgi:hypothetical protein